MTKMYTLEDAVLAARAFTRHPQIEEVYLFGSVARNGAGHDIDLLFICSEDIVRKFWDSVRDEEYLERWVEQLLADFEGGLGPDLIKANCQYAPRESSLIEALGPDMHNRMHEAMTVLGCPDESPFDIFILPPDWRANVQELARAHPQRDPQFWNNIARDALSLLSDCAFGQQVFDFDGPG